MGRKRSRVKDEAAEGGRSRVSARIRAAAYALFSQLVASPSDATFAGAALPPDLSEALGAANATEYGLHASLFSNDLHAVYQAYGELEVGALVVNDIPAWRADDAPHGGAKGSGLSLMFECLVSLLGANALLEPILRPGGDPSGFRQNGLCVAIDISAFVGLEDYQSQVDDLAAAITSLPRAEGVDRIYAPGERGDAILAEREQNGIPLPQGTWDRLAEAVGPLGVEMPARG